MALSDMQGKALGPVCGSWAEVYSGTLWLEEADGLWLSPASAPHPVLSPAALSALEASAGTSLQPHNWGALRKPPPPAPPERVGSAGWLRHFARFCQGHHVSSFLPV